MLISELREEYHRRVCGDVVRIRAHNCPSFADSASKSSVDIAHEVIKELGHKIGVGPVSEQSAQKRFEEITAGFPRASIRVAQAHPTRGLASLRSPVSRLAPAA